MEKPIIKPSKPSISKNTTPSIRQTKSKGKGLPPNFNSLFSADVQSPVEGMTYTDDPETDAKEEISRTLQALRENEKLRRNQYTEMVDTEFWCAICFQSRGQKDEFLEKLGLLRHGDKYLDGLFVARVLGVDIKPVLLERKSIPPMSKHLKGIGIINKGGDS